MGSKPFYIRQTQISNVYIKFLVQENTLELRPYKFDNLDDETFRRKIIGAGGRGK